LYLLLSDNTANVQREDDSPHRLGVAGVGLMGSEDPADSTF